jgi:hypothetical protein
MLPHTVQASFPAIPANQQHNAAAHVMQALGTLRARSGQLSHSGQRLHGPLPRPRPVPQQLLQDDLRSFGAEHIAETDEAVQAGSDETRSLDVDDDDDTSAP